MKHNCPRCFATDCLLVVAAYVYSTKGVEDQPDFRVETLGLDTAHISQKLYLCQQCQAHVPEPELRKAQQLQEKTIYWQRDVRGRRIPVVCPQCKNAQHFVVKTLVLSEQDVPVEVMSENHLKELQTVADRVDRGTIPLTFVCANERCRGEIFINEDAFEVKPLS